jgi:hypothetical protein
MNEIQVCSIGGMMLTVKTEVLEEETVSVTLNPPQTLLEDLWDQIRSDLHGGKSATKCLSHSMC